MKDFIVMAILFGHNLTVEHAQYESALIGFIELWRNATSIDKFADECCGDGSVMEHVGYLYGVKIFPIIFSDPKITCVN